MADLVIKISGDVKNFQDALDKAEEKTESLGNSLKDIAKASGALFAALTAEVLLTTRAFSAEEQALNAVTLSMQNQGVYTKQLATDYRKWAEAIEEKTGVDGDQVSQGQATLQSMIGQTRITEDLTKAVVDLSVAKKIDLGSAFDLVGKAINGQVMGLQRMGFELDQTGTREQRVGQIVDQISQKLGGQAEKATEGTGAIKLLEANFGNLEKELGRRFAPAVEAVIRGLTEFIAKVKENKPVLDLIVAFTAAGIVVSGLGLAAGVAGLAFLKLKAALEAARIATTAMELATKGLVAATGLGLLVILITEIYLNWDKIWPRMQAVYQAFVTNISAMSSGLGEILNGVFSFDIDKIKKGFAEVKGAISKGYQDATASLPVASGPTSSGADSGQDAHKKEAADRAEAIRRERERYQIQATRAQNEALRLEMIDGEKERIDLIKQEAEIETKLADEHFKGDREALKRHLTELKELRQEYFSTTREEEEQRHNEQQSALQEHFQNERDQHEIFENEYLQKNEAFQNMDATQQAAFLGAHRQQLEGAIKTESQIRDDAMAEELNRQITFYNDLAANKEKLGSFLGTIKTTVGLEVFGNVAEGAAGAAKAVSSIVGGVVNMIPVIGPMISGIVKGLTEFLAQGPEKVSKIVREFELAVPGVVGNIIKSIPALIGTVIGDAAELVSSILGDMLPNAITAILNAIPVLIGALIRAIPDVITAIIDAIPVLFDALIDGVFNMVTTLVQEAPKFIFALVEKVPMIIEKLVGLAPQLIMKLVEKIPDFITGLVQQLPTIAMGLVMELIREVPKLIMAFVVEMPKMAITFVAELIKGIWNGLKKIFEGLFDFLGLGSHADPNATVQGVDLIHGMSPQDIAKAPEIISQLNAQAHASGGIVTGRSSGEDSVLSWLTPGELVVPRGNFEEVINAVAASRLGMPSGGAGAAGGGVAGARVLIGFDGPEASRVLTARQVEDRALGLSVEAS